MEKDIAKAALQKDWTRVRYLVEQGNDVNVVSQFGRTALLWAAYWRNKEMCECLLKSGANVNASDEYGDQPLHKAASEKTKVRCVNCWLTMEQTWLVSAWMVRRLL